MPQQKHDLGQTLQPLDDAGLESAQEQRRPVSQVEIHAMTAKAPVGGRVLKPRPSNARGSTPTSITSGKLNQATAKRRPKSRGAGASVNKMQAPTDENDGKKGGLLARFSKISNFTDIKNDL